MAGTQKNPAVTGSNSQHQSSSLSPMMVLRELFELLEDYSPTWYKEETHQRAFAALMQHPR